MLKNYFEVDENLNLSAFLKGAKEKKNSHYIILDTKPASFVDIRTISLKLSNLNDKLKGMKKGLNDCNENDASKLLNFLMDSGDRVIKGKDGYFDFIDALDEILRQSPDFLDQKIDSIEKKEIYALNANDKIAAARNLFLNKRINLLPVIDGLSIIGELRPIDFLVTDLFETHDHGTNFYSSKYRNNILNLPINNLINTRPITIDRSRKIREVVDTMAKKKLPSLIITDLDNKLFSVISYNDIFKLYRQATEKPKYHIEYSGGSDLFADEFDLIQDFAEKTMLKIIKISDYDHMRINFKIIGEKDISHKKKVHIKILLSQGNKIINVEKEMVEGTSDEIRNDKVKDRWNVPLTASEALDVIYKKVKDEKKKSSRQ
jgi:CBS domain-containing protein